jgi:hypothetical protein
MTAANTGERTLRSLNGFLDVVFALAFFRTIEFLPMPASGQLSRKNALLGLVQTADGAFALLAIGGLAALCVFLYALAADPTCLGSWPTLLLQSASLFVASLLAYLALRYPIHTGLVSDASKTAAQRIARVDLSNPVTALIATALSWSGLTIWTVSWLMPLLGFVLARTAPSARA